MGQVTAFLTGAEAIENGVHIVRDGEEARPQRPAPGGLKWPVVKFTDGSVILVIQEDFTVNNADGGMEAKREQVSAGECCSIIFIKSSCGRFH